jgi:hypothetical protein
MVLPVESNLDIGHVQGYVSAHIQNASFVLSANAQPVKTTSIKWPPPIGPNDGLTCLTETSPDSTKTNQTDPQLCPTIDRKRADTYFLPWHAYTL